MSNYLDVAEAPITITIGDKQIHLEPLQQEDYLNLLEELTNQMRTSDEKTLKEQPAIKPLDRFDLARRIKNASVIPADLESLVFVPKYTSRILELIKTKNQISDEEWRKFLKGRSLKQNEMLAVYASGLFTRDRLADLYPPSSGSQLVALARLLIDNKIITEDQIMRAFDTQRREQAAAPAPQATDGGTPDPNA